MVIGLLEVSISLPESNSLKDKRSIVRSVRDRISSRMNVSVAEVGKQDVWKAAELAFVTVGGCKDTVQKRLANICTMISTQPRLVVLDLHTEFL